jgi:hypothetical protein
MRETLGVKGAFSFFLFSFVLELCAEKGTEETKEVCIVWLLFRRKLFLMKD